MTTGVASPRKVLAVMDDSEAQTALHSASALAERHGARLEVACCVEPPHDLSLLARLSGRPPDRLLDDLVERRGREMRERLAAHLGGRDLEFRLMVGKTFVEVIRHVISAGCDFVVKAAEPLPAGRRFLFASTDQHLLRKCPCPVWLQTPDAGRVPRRVIAAVDVDALDAAEPDTLFSLNRRVIETALSVAAPEGAQVTALHAWDALAEGLVWAFSSGSEGGASAGAYVQEVREARQASMQRLLLRIAGDAPGGAQARLEPRLVRGPADKVIEEQSRELDADAVVMGTVARTGLSGVFIGNTAENIINSLECSVIAVKPDGFISPLDPR